MQAYLSDETRTTKTNMVFHIWQIYRV